VFYSERIQVVFPPFYCQTVKCGSPIVLVAAVFSSVAAVFFCVWL